MKKWLLSLLVVTVYLLHQDGWNWQRTEPLVFGFLPIGLAYHAGYSVLAALLMWVLVRFAWPNELDEMEQESPVAPRTPNRGAEPAAAARGSPAAHPDGEVPEA